MVETDVHGEHVFALRVKDDSMEPLFHTGETVFVNPALPADDDQYVIVLEEVTPLMEPTSGN
ncbi:MAG: S24 family peptidase [Nitrospiraceae bacterium]